MASTFLVIGLGRFGTNLALRLMHSGNEVMVLDSDEELVNHIAPQVTQAKIGDCMDEEVLRSLDPASFDFCFVCISENFQSSMETTSLLKELGARNVIARASRGVQEKFLLRNGADEVVYPEKQLASWTAIRCTSEHILDYIELDEDYSIFELSIPEPWQGKSILQLDLRKRYGINVLGVRAEGRLHMNITPETVLDADRSVLILGQQKLVQKLLNR